MTAGTRKCLLLLFKFYPNTFKFGSNKLFNSKHEVSLCICISPLIFTSSYCSTWPDWFSQYVMLHDTWLFKQSIEKTSLYISRKALTWEGRGIKLWKLIMKEWDETGDRLQHSACASLRHHVKETSFFTA
jgi:hypothetical protein